MFNKETEYALRGLVYIQTQNLLRKRPGIDEISRETEAPRFFIAKILHRLVRNGFLMSIKGKGGGFYIDQGKPDLTLLEIVNLTEGGSWVDNCAFGLKNCDKEQPCPLHAQYAPIRKALLELITTETIQSMAKKYQEKL